MILTVLMQVYSHDYCYLGSIYENFAEIMARYVEGSITDKRLC